MINVAVVGGTGYTGYELIRLILAHPQTNLVAVTSRAELGIPLSDVFPALLNQTSLCFSEPSVKVLEKAEVVFFATPHGIAMKQAPELLANGQRVIDLSADFRIHDAALWERTYNMPHTCVEWLQKAVYGLPEFRRESIAKAQLIANPGCYPTAVQLALLPFLTKKLVNTQHIIADVKSGISGAGRQANIGLLYCELNENVHAYKLDGHRHAAEISQELSLMNSNVMPHLTFVPHLMPMSRGILATVYINPAERALSLMDMHKELIDFYKDEPFVSVLPAGQSPKTRDVRGTNFCHLSISQPAGDKGPWVVVSAIDNLLKGAASQAIQNMNVMFGWKETQGLEQLSVLP